MFTEPETWVAIAFVILMVLFAYLGIHRTVLKALDHRAERIKAELDDARRLKEEAAKLLDEYKTRRATAEREAEEIVSAARAEAERIATEVPGNANYSYMRFVYSTTGNRVDTYELIQTSQGESHAFQIADGHGRVFAAASNHPGSTGGCHSDKVSSLHMSPLLQPGFGNRWG